MSDIFYYSQLQPIDLIMWKL